MTERMWGKIRATYITNTTYVLAVEQLTDIIIRQAKIIKELHSIVGQLDAVTELDGEIEKIQEETKNFIETPE